MLNKSRYNKFSSEVLVQHGTEYEFVYTCKTCFILPIGIYEHPLTALLSFAERGLFQQFLSEMLHVLNVPHTKLVL